MSLRQLKLWFKKNDVDIDPNSRWEDCVDIAKKMIKVNPEVCQPEHNLWLKFQFKNRLEKQVCQEGARNWENGE